MAIYNPDGSVYQLSGELTQYDPCNPEFALFNQYDQESIEIAGSPLFYYECMIQMQTVDELYLEDRGKIWASEPVMLYSFYEPIPSQYAGTVWGNDSPDEIMFQFNYQDSLRRLGRLPKKGSRLYSPHKRENWVIIQLATEEFRLWGQLRLQVMCQRFRESLTTGEGKVTQARPAGPSVDELLRTPPPGPLGQNVC